MDGLLTSVTQVLLRLTRPYLSLCLRLQVDVWSLGCILAELSSSFVLFQVRAARRAAPCPLPVTGLTRWGRSSARRLAMAGCEPAVAGQLPCR